jgi:hypothetical protein
VGTLELETLFSGEATLELDKFKVKSLELETTGATTLELETSTGAATLELETSLTAVSILELETSLNCKSLPELNSLADDVSTGERAPLGLTIELLSSEQAIRLKTVETAITGSL